MLVTWIKISSRSYKTFFLRFLIFAVKLSHFTINYFFLYIINTQTYHWKTKKFFVSKEKSFIGLATELLKLFTIYYIKYSKLLLKIFTVQAALVICSRFICEFAYIRLKNGLCFWNLSSNLQWSLVFLYANSLYASIFWESLSLAYNEVHLYFIF